jgi:GT2 family glycosyltransferase
MNSNPLLSVVIPAYEDTYRLSFTLAGLIDQPNLSSTEVLVVNSGSLSLQSLIDSYSSRIPLRYFELSSPGPGLQAKARNIGLSQALAPRTLFLDQDCIPHPGILKAHATYSDTLKMVVGYRLHVPIDRQPPLRIENIHIAYAQTWSADMRFHTLKTFSSDWDLIYGFGMTYSCHLSVPTTLARKIGGFWDAMEGWGSEDQELGLRLARAGCFVILRDDLLVTHLDHKQRPFSQKTHDLWEKTLGEETITRDPLPSPYPETLYHSYPNVPSIASLSMATHPNPGLFPFRQSCQKHQINPYILGLGSEWRGWRTKLNFIYNFLKAELPEYILWLDAYDSLVQEPISDLWDKFTTFKKDFVFSADAHPWPNESVKELFPDIGSPLRYLCAGQWFGKADFLISMLHDLGAPFTTTIDDQELLQYYYLAHSDEIALDYHSLLFHPLWGTESITNATDKGVVNTLSQNHPFAIHGNGHFDMTPFYQLLGYK